MNTHKVRNEDGKAIVRIEEVRQVRIGLSSNALDHLRYESRGDIEIPKEATRMLSEGGYQLILTKYSPDDDPEEQAREEEEDANEDE